MTLHALHIVQQLGFIPMLAPGEEDGRHDEDEDRARYHRGVDYEDLRPLLSSDRRRFRSSHRGHHGPGWWYAREIGAWERGD